MTDHRRMILAAAEKEAARSWIMLCGHYTNYETQQFYRVWKPKDRDYYCEQCAKWQAKARTNKGQESASQQTFPF